MPENEKVTREELEWVEGLPRAGDAFLFSCIAEAARFADIARRSGVDNADTARAILLAVRAAYARQHEPTKAEQVAFAAAEFVRKASTFLTDNVPTYGAKPATLRADSDGRWQIKDSTGRVVAEGFPRKAPEQATPAPETNPPIGGKAWEAKPEAATAEEPKASPEMEWVKDGDSGPWILRMHHDVRVGQIPNCDAFGATVPGGSFGDSILSKPYNDPRDAMRWAEEWLRTKTSPLHAARLEKVLGQAERAQDGQREAMDERDAANLDRDTMRRVRDSWHAAALRLQVELDRSRATSERRAKERDGLNEIINQLNEELARTKAALAEIKRDDSGLRAALEKCEATMEGARVHHIGATAGIQWADIVLPGGLLVRVKGGAK